MTPVLGIVPDKLCELSDGRWLLSAHYQDVAFRLFDATVVDI